MSSIQTVITNANVKIAQRYYRPQSNRSSYGDQGRGRNSYGEWTGDRSSRDPSLKRGRSDGPAFQRSDPNEDRVN